MTRLFSCMAVALGLFLLSVGRASSGSSEGSALAQASADKRVEKTTDRQAGGAGDNREQMTAGKTADTFERPELWFPVGESLTYKIRWGIFTVGTTRVFSEWIREDGRDLVAIRVTTRSTRFFDRIYRVDDFLESIVDPVTFTPLRFTKRLSEGRYRCHEITTFDHKAGTAHWRHLLKDKSKDFAIEPDTRDLLSFMFYMRSQKFEPEKEYHFRVMADEKIYDLDVISKTYETTKLRNFGRIKSLRLEPNAKFQGLFVRLGKMRVWISDDDRFLCVKATARVPIGTIKLKLTKVEGPGDDFWSRAGTGTVKSAMKE